VVINPLVGVTVTPAAVVSKQRGSKDSQATAFFGLVRARTFRRTGRPSPENKEVMR
jgi:hypothetical protein